MFFSLPFFVPLFILMCIFYLPYLFIKYFVDKNKDDKDND